MPVKKDALMPANKRKRTLASPQTADPSPWPCPLILSDCYQNIQKGVNGIITSILPSQQEPKEQGPEPVIVERPTRRAPQKLQVVDLTSNAQPERPAQKKRAAQVQEAQAILEEEPRVLDLHQNDKTSFWAFTRLNAFWNFLTACCICVALLIFCIFVYITLASFATWLSASAVTAFNSILAILGDEQKKHIPDARVGVKYISQPKVSQLVENLHDYF